MIHQTMTELVKKMLGANVRFAPMYPNFPAQVMNTVESE
jgi:hypothetical protein